MTQHRSGAARLLTVSDVADTLQISERTIRRMVSTGEIAVIRLGRVIRVHPDALAKLLGQEGTDVATR